MSFFLGLCLGVYLGIGVGYALTVLVEVGIGRGRALVWRVPMLILLWPGLFIAALAGA